jgi:glutamyl-tRNA synthetase
LLRPDGNGKLSKRDGDRLGFPVFPTNWITSEGELYSGYREQEYFPDAFINMLVLLGWNPGTPQEIFSMEELIEVFSLERVGKAGAKFDADKTKWFQQQYLRSKSNEELAEIISKKLTFNCDRNRLIEICRLMKERATFPRDIIVEGAYLFKVPTQYDSQTVSKKWKEDSSVLMNEWKEILASLSDFNSSSIEASFKQFLDDKKIGIGSVLPLFRLLITGQGMGPSMFEIANFLGKEECLSRINLGLQKLEKTLSQ